MKNVDPSNVVAVTVSRRTVGLGLAAMGAVTLLFAHSAGWLRLGRPPALDATSGLAVIFLAGLLAGGLSCLAVQGGLLATAIAHRNPTAAPGRASSRSQTGPVVAFLAAKIVAYTGLGFALGYLGSFLSLSPVLRGLLQVVVGGFMVVVALQLLDIHPALRRLTIGTPKPLQRLIRREARRGGLLTPFVLGALTVFLPCGVTQATELVAMATGDPWRGAAVMFSFTLGTVPLFFVLGVAAVRVSHSWQNGFRYLSAAVLVMAGLAIVSGLRTAGWVPVTSGRVAGATTAGSLAGPSAGNVDATHTAGPTDVQELTIQVVDHGYLPDRLAAKAGIPIRLKLVTDNVFSCARAFTIPALGVQRVLPPTGVDFVDLPAQPPGQLVFVCSMGMYGGTIEVNP